jgi:hypothetical protein
VDAELVSQLNALGLAIPAGISGAVLFAFVFYMKTIERKQDRDRDEHIKKWESLVELQKHINEKIMDSHKIEMDRQFKLHERTTAALEGLTHHLSILTKDMK